ncbi:uncharacterized protein KY384_007770 [Bacidia gigantensis]|uniref:uncharacterized protein n=1 Tax=Bacidia gigantensis TaxID=2732470 RepID=UPI001D041938|nr:uncharacterized protein KY384_007770 [Bacidia gigantensis]KAG8527617.1 hypothetical protein KY384_007770 [Bacidia gigantensis]
MSGREPTSNVTAEGKPKTMQKFKRRISKILGKDDVKQANAAAAATSSAAAASEPTTIQGPVKSETSAEGPAKTASKATTPAKTDEGMKPAAVSLRPKSAMTALENAKIQEEKVRAMFAKYNMSLDAGDWKPTFKQDTPRVEKKVRMRVHRTCHRCQTQFGVDKICNNCNHARCKKCPRYPLAKKEKELRTKDGSTAVASDTGYVKKPVTQRSRRICHKCQTPFKSKTSACEKCQHERCEECRRATAKSDTASGTFTKWTCHECRNVHRDPENPCLKCGHSKCDSCSKELVKKADPAKAAMAKTKDAGDVKEIQRRMDQMGVGTSQASAA